MAKKRAARSRNARPSRPVRKTTVKRGKPSVVLPDRRQKDPASLRLRTFMPGLTVNDLEKSTRFYVDTLGFIVSDRWVVEGKLVGVMLKAGVCELGLSQDDWKKGRDRKKGQGVRIWCNTAQSIDDLAKRIKTAGGAIADGPKDEPWGARTLGISDPDGYQLTFVKTDDKK